MGQDAAREVGFSDSERELLRKCVHSFDEAFSERVIRPVSSHLDLVPQPVGAFRDRLRALQQSLGDREGSKLLDDLPILRAALLYRLRSEMARHEEREWRTPDKDTKAELLAELQPLLDLAASPLIQSVKPAQAPVLSDYLVISQIQEWFQNSSAAPPRTYDEKFRILQAPTLFLPDLAYERVQCCELRGRPVSVGYVDIDDFKSINTLLTEPRVDREILPTFMRVLEAATYRQGYAYRFGGDEYAFLLPNRGQEDAVQFFHRLQADLAAADYGDSNVRPTVSVGVCEVRQDSPLTDRQVEEHAATAKNFAKQHGKDCVAGFNASLPSENGLQVLERRA